MLNTNDYNEINETVKIIAHIRDDTPPNQPASHLTLIEYLDIAAFILLTSKDLFFNANGKPKNFMQLVGSIGRIITFVRDLVRMINHDTGKKALRRRIKEANDYVDVIEVKDRNNQGK